MTARTLNDTNCADSMEPDFNDIQPQLIPDSAAVSDAFKNELDKIQISNIKQRQLPTENELGVIDDDEAGLAGQFCEQSDKEMDFLDEIPSKQVQSQLPTFDDVCRLNTNNASNRAVDFGPLLI